MTQRRAKVGLIIPSFGPERDAPVVTPTLTTLVDALGAFTDAHVFPLRYPPTREHRQHGRAMIHGIDGSALRLRRLVPRVLAAVAAEHRRGRFDVLHALWLHEPGTLALLARLPLRVPTLASIGGAEVASLPEIAYGGWLAPSGRRVNGWVLRNADLVSGGSEYVLRLARRRCPGRDSADFRLAPLPVDPDFSPGPARPYDLAAPRLLHVASLIPVKDQELLLRAFARIVAQLPGARLDIAGEDPFGLRADLERLRDELGLADVVRFLGQVEHARMPERYRAADLLLLTSRHESQALAVLEAAACGVPTVGMAVGVVPELAPRAAVAVAERDPDTLADATLALLRDPDRLAAIGRDARSVAVERYAVAPAVERFRALYAELMERRR